ncbi:MAG: cupin domain-containing protein [Panacibacter sp.]
MNITYPHTIENCIGEKLIFREVRKENGDDVVLVENFVVPGSGPVMHTHLLQDEGLTVIKGRMAYQVKDQPVQYAAAGESVVFKRGVPHRFWNDGEEILNCTGWLKPANTIVFYLSSIYAAQNKSGNAQPERFDGAYLIKRYASEYDLPEIPVFVKKIIIPVTYYIGLLSGKYKHFKNAPAPVKG